MSSPEASIRKHLLAGIVMAVLLVGAVGGWAATTNLAGAVIAAGHLVVDSNVKKVQHAKGGIIGELNVRNGDHVRAGDVLVRLDETLTKANLSMVSKQLDELTARRARLLAEQEGAESIEFPKELLERKEDAEAARLIAGEHKLFELRQTSRAGRKAQLRERVTQLGQEISGLEHQAKAKSREIELIKRELTSVKNLWEKNLIPLSRLTALERQAAQIDGEHGRLIATAAQSKGKKVEVALQILQIDQDLRSEVAAELAQVRANIAELGERKIAAEDQMRRVDIRSPQDGVVHQLQVHTVGGVIQPGQVMMLIVPQADTLTVEARVAPSDIDQLRQDQSVTLRLSAFSQRTTPELEGSLKTVSADLSQDEVTGQSYYIARIIIPDEEIAKLEGLTLIPGMPVEAFFKTGDRSVLSYLIKPLTDYAARAFREG